MEALADAELIAAAGPRALTPDVPRDVLRDIARSPRFQAFRSASAECARMRQKQMLDRQALIARMEEQNEYKASDGLGEKVASIDAEAYFQMRALYGDDCWSDPHFVAAFLRDNPQCRVRTTRGTKGQEYGGRPAGRQPDRHRGAAGTSSQYAGRGR